MRNVLSILAWILMTSSSGAQAIFNEIYSDPGAGRSEFIELYNSGTGPQNTDCFTLLSYWEEGNERGWYVLDLPNQLMNAKSQFVLAARSPFNCQGNTGLLADLDYNDPDFRSGATGGYLRKYRLNGNGYVQVDITGQPQDNILMGTSPVGSTSKTRYLFLFKNGDLVNGFAGGASEGSLPDGITFMPALFVNAIGPCAENFTVSFNAMAPVEFEAGDEGSDYGYTRLNDGKCGSWKQSSPSILHSPKISNGKATGAITELLTRESVYCSILTGFTRFTLDITGLNGLTTEAEDFPLTIQVYYDQGNSLGVLDAGDVFAASRIHTELQQPPSEINLLQNRSVLIIYRTQKGCFEKVVSIPAGCETLPVSIAYFSAIRKGSQVNLIWKTTYELNNSGFYIERNVSGNWQQVGFVPSQGQNGVSNDILTYAFVDFNNIKGITQYRLRQQDFDGKSKHSETRSVRGEEQPVKLTVYPNPTADGKVNIVFDDAIAVRNVTVSDMSGRIVKQMNGITNNNITIENLQPGMYTVRVVVPETGAQGVEKIIVNKR